MIQTNYLDQDLFDLYLLEKWHTKSGHYKRGHKIFNALNFNNDIILRLYQRISSLQVSGQNSIVEEIASFYNI